MTKAKPINFRRWEEIEPNNRTEFSMLYNHSLRALKRLISVIKNEDSAALSKKSHPHLHRIQHKIEQMSEHYKATRNELDK